MTSVSTSSMSVVEGFALSPQQERIWFLREEGAWEAPACVCAVRLREEPDPEWLRIALDRVVQRHEILRTELQRVPGLKAPLQVIGEPPMPHLDLLDLQSSPPDEREARLAELVRKMEHPADGAPRLQAALVRLSEGPHLFLGLPAMCSDARGMENLVREIERVYEAGPDGAPFADEPLQYADVSGWLNDLRESQDAMSRKYWQSRDVLPHLEARLPWLHPEAGGGFEPRRLPLAMSPELANQVGELALRQKVSVAAVLLAAWTVLLQRVAGRPVIVGTSFDGRRDEELQRALGLFARHVPLQVVVEEGVPFEDVLRATDRSMAELAVWQDSFDWSTVFGGGESPGFFPYAFEGGEQPSPGTALAVEWCRACFDRFELRLRCGWREEELSVELDYDAGVLRREEVARVGSWYQTLLADALARPTIAALDLEILPPQEEAHLEALRGARVDFGPARTLAGCFEDQVARTPDRIALVDGDEALTFAELDDRAGRLAAFLGRLGVGPEDRVALAVERSVDMIVGILGVLKAGAAYVPMDPAYPESRRSLVIEDAGARLLLTQEALLDHMAGLAPAVVCLDRDWPEISAAGGGRRREGADPDNLAYVIYTSGSTGRPKGVGISHRAILNRLLWMQRELPLTESDRVLLKTPYIFDASIWEIFLPLITGARLAVAAPGAHRDVAALLEEVSRQGVTVLQLVPSLLSPFVDQPGVKEGCRTLRRLFCGGESLPGSLAVHAGEVLGVEVCNLYGPTEASIDATFRRHASEIAEATAPIGRPLDNVDVHLLDRHGREVPPGLVGELHIGGPGLARGYLGRPSLTAERFVPHLEGGDGARLYRTGDLAVLGTDGEIRFQGRLDHQVKIRGFRIELGEIEAALLRHPAVRTAVVTVRDDGAAGPRLVAYVILRTEADAEALRALLTASLPEHMVPAAVVVLDELPRLPNGKLDRAALPAPEQMRSEMAQAFVAPRTPTEEILAGIWSEMLGVEHVGVHDGFFELGGHSLNATRVMVRIRDVFRIDLSVRKLFEEPTVAALAQAVEQEQRSSQGLEVPDLSRAPRGIDLPLSFGQQRLWFLQQLEPESPAYNIPGALRLKGELDQEALTRAIAAILRRHEVLRTVFALHQGEPVQIIRPDAPWEIPVIDLSPLPEAERSQEVLTLVAQEAVRPFDLAAGPLLRTSLLRLDAREHVFLFNLHHIVSDGWSVALLVNELSAFYEAGRRGGEPGLPELPIQYADYAVWQRQSLVGEVLERQLAYWRDRLAGAPEVINLPTDRPHPARQTYRGATRNLVLSGELCAALRQLSRDASVTLFTTLLGTFKAVLQRYGAGDDLVVGTNAANRGRKEVEGLIGFFVNALVLRTDLSGDPGFREVLARVRETVLGAFTHQDLPFDRVVEELQPRRDLAVTPLFQIVFDMDPASKGTALELEGLELSSLALPNRTAKFDLNLTLSEQADGVRVATEYSTDLLDAATVDRLLGHFEGLLRSVAAHPEERLRALPLLAEEEVFHLLHEVQGPERPGYPLDQTLQALFVRQATQTPHQVAAVCGDERLTYAELDRRSESLALRLQGLGVGPGHFVGILDERGIGFLLSMLAIFKAGGAYVPFEPSYPEDRLRHMLTNSGITVLVARADLAAQRLARLRDCPELRGVICLGGNERLDLPAGLRCELFDPSAEGPSGSLPAERPGRGSSGDPAYMLYTSGSTGLPKGAVIRHDGAVNHIWAQFEALDLGPELCFLQSAPSSSDISVWQFLAPLVIGGRTVIVDMETVSDPRRLLGVLREERVTIVELVPAVLRDLIDHATGLPPEERALPALRWMMATGEAVPVDLVNDWLTLYPEIRVVNAYGPTEAADDVTQAVFDRPLPPGVHSLSIGRPLANFTCHVVDRDLQLTPLGVPGELCIGGVGVGNGYWRNPEKTSQSFVPDPFARTSGAVLYRTGDLVRWRPGGMLEFLGRIDHQVKIRGFRIELGEIEAALREHSAVRDVVVVVRGEGAHRNLVAYVESEDGTVDAGVLRDSIQARLPGHMLPADYVLLPALPRTPNGKIDRRALPAPDRSTGPAGPVDPPRTPVEQKLVEIWMQVFQLDAVGRDTDFFEIGGHSLLAVRVLSRVQAAFEVEIPLRQIFEHSTIASFARVVESRRSRVGGALPEIKRVARQAQRLPAAMNSQPGTRSRK